MATVDVADDGDIKHSVFPVGNVVETNEWICEDYVCIQLTLGGARRRRPSITSQSPSTKHTSVLRIWRGHIHEQPNMACSGVSKHGFCADAGLDLQRTECGWVVQYFGEAREGFNGYSDPTVLEYGSILSNDALVEEFSTYVRLRVPLGAGPVLDCIGGTVTM